MCCLWFHGLMDREVAVMQEVPNSKAVTSKCFFPLGYKLVVLSKCHKCWSSAKNRSKKFIACMCHSQVLASLCVYYNISWYGIISCSLIHFTKMFILQIPKTHSLNCTLCVAWWILTWQSLPLFKTMSRSAYLKNIHRNTSLNVHSSRKGSMLKLGAGLMRGRSSRVV